MLLWVAGSQRCTGDTCGLKGGASTAPPALVPSLQASWMTPWLVAWTLCWLRPQSTASS